MTKADSRFLTMSLISKYDYKLATNTGDQQQYLVDCSLSDVMKVYIKKKI